MKMIINVQDQVLGSWHQITVEKADAADGTLVRLDGTAVPYDYELVRRIKQTLGSWEDELEGVTDKEHHL